MFRSTSLQGKFPKKLPLKSQTSSCSRDYGSREVMVSRETLPSEEEHLSSCWSSLVSVVLERSISLWQEGGDGESVVDCVSAAVTVVVGPARWRGGVGLVVKFAKWRGIIGSGVDVSLLEWRRVEVGPFIRKQVVFVQCLERQSRKKKN